MDFRKMNQLNSDDNPIPVVDQDPMESLNNPNFAVDPMVDREPQLSDVDVQKEIDMVSDDMSLDIPEGISENPQAPEPMISEGLNRQQILDAYRRLKPAQEKYQQDLSNIGMLQGANMIAQGFARGHGANIGAGEEGIRALQAQSKEGIDSIGRELDTAKNTMGTSKMLMDYDEAEKMNDPNSDVSKLYREQAYNTLKKINPESPLIGRLDNMSASQLSKLGFKGFNELGVKKFQQSQYIEKSSGDPLSYDPTSDTYRNAITGASVSPGDVVRPVAYTNAFGDREYVGPGGNVTVQSSRRNKMSNDQLSEKANEFTPDKEQREAFKTEKSRIDTLSKDINEKISAASRVLSALDGNSKQAIAVIQTQMPRLAGESGNLNQSEQEVWRGSQSWLDRLQQYISTGVSSEITPENKKELRAIIGTFLSEADNARNSIMDSSANSLAQLYNIPPEFTKSAYGTVRKITPRQQEVMSGEHGAPKKTSKSTTSPGMVRMKTPDGRLIEIPKENVEKAKARGAVEVK